MRNFFGQPVGGSKKYRRAYAALADQATEDMYQTVRYRSLHDTLIEPYLQSVFSKLLMANPHLPPVRLVVARSPVANAYAAGGGTIVCNVGLLAKLENESQLAFVLSHELAHAYFDHVRRGLTEHFDTFYSAAFQKEIRKISREEYNTRSKVRSLIQESSLEGLYHNRLYEQQADSMGYQLMTTAGFLGSQAYTTLRLLDQIDVPTSDAAAVPPWFACSDTHPLWIGDAAPASSSIFMVQREKPTAFERSDTLKSHLNCLARATFIQTILEHPYDTMRVEGSPTFNQIRSASQLETIHCWFNHQRYDLALFKSWQQANTPFSSSYLQAVTLLSLYKLKLHLQNHTYADVVAGPADHHPEGMNQLLRALQALNVSDFAQLARCVYQSSSPRSDGEYPLAAEYVFYRLTEQTAGAAQAKAKYLAYHPDGELSPFFE
ncbi:MAG: M48 family metallopeptidase [Tunicatimonas sp.]